MKDYRDNHYGCEQDRLIAEAYQRGREDVLKEDAIRQKTELLKLQHAGYTDTNY